MKMTRDALISAFLIFLFVGGATAQRPQKLSAMPKAFQTFFASFRAAVIKGDKNAVAVMTRFPFEYGFDAGDEGTFSRSQFIKRYNDIFGGARKIFAKSKPTFYLESGSYSLANPDDASSFMFKKMGTIYKFAGFYVEP
jgi:hypothetical protein